MRVKAPRRSTKRSIAQQRAASAAANVAGGPSSKLEQKLEQARAGAARSLRKCFILLALGVSFAPVKLAGSPSLGRNLGAATTGETQRYAIWWLFEVPNLDADSYTGRQAGPIGSKDL